MKKLMAILAIMICAVSLVSCGKANDNKVVIYSCMEEVRSQYFVDKLNKQFPNYKIDLQYMSTGNLGAKLKAEGEKSECDIILALESSYLIQNEESLADLSSYPTDKYLDNILPKNKKYLPIERDAASIIIRTDLLKEKGLQEPKSYQDLLKPEYKGLISMPNPKSSGMGYAFLKSLVNAYGEDEAFKYFDELSKNITQFTSSGSGPVNALVQGEAVIGMGMTFQAVNEINAGIPLKILVFEEGSPNTICGFAMLKGRDTKTAVKAVFDYINEVLIYDDKELFVPDQIFKEQENTIANYPKDIKYSDMSSDDAVTEKAELLSKWTH
ncbi:MAG: extracellular solute-binding protein [Oscillospiraceae bacterium]